MKETEILLDLISPPAFIASSRTVLSCNAAARTLLLEPGQSLDSLLLTGADQLQSLTEGCLYLQLSLPGGPWGAAVTVCEGRFIFLLDQEGGELQALALAARELRGPMNSLLAISSQLLPSHLPQNDRTAQLLARMSRELYRLQRTAQHMSDAQGISSQPQEMGNCSRVFGDIFEKARTLLAHSGICLEFQSLREDVYSLLDTDQVEQAVLNILSNSAKFLEPGGSIQASLTRQGPFLRLTVTDNGPGIPGDILPGLFTRYLRQPGLEDSRFGLGLGMVLIRNAAAAHGGTVLVDQAGGHARITLTLRIRQSSQARFRSPRTDLTGGQDQALVELSEILPPEVYQKEL